MINTGNYSSLRSELKENATLVAVSKFKPAEDIQALYELGQRDFGENYVQELCDKQVMLPPDIRWHFIGHLQSNKVKYIASFIHLIHGVDKLSLLKEINKQAVKHDRIIDCLLQVHIASEETKFGLNEEELDDLINTITADTSSFTHIRICGLMGMASFSDDQSLVKKEFTLLRTLHDRYSALSTANCQLSILSMGMSNDYTLALECGSNMVRIGSLLFGNRNNPK